MNGLSPEFVTVSYAYRAKALPTVPQRIRRVWVKASFRETVNLPIQRAEDWEAPVVAILERKGAQLEIRRQGDRFLRPVLDGAVPLTVERLHVRAGEPLEWKDDPFERRIDAKAIAYVEADWKHCVRLPARSVPLDRLAADLLIVDGIVYVPCEPPRYQVRTVVEWKDGKKAYGFGLGWELSHDIREDLPKGASVHSVEDIAFELDRRDEALRYVALIARLTGRFPVPEPKVDVLRPDLLPPPLLRSPTTVNLLAEEIFRRIGGPFNKWTIGYKDAIPKPLKLDLMAAQEALETDSPEASRIALDMLWAAMTKAMDEGVDLSLALPSGAAKTKLANYQTVERRSLSEEDLEAIADLDGPT